MGPKRLCFCGGFQKALKAGSRSPAEVMTAPARILRFWKSNILWERG